MLEVESKVTKRGVLQGFTILDALYSDNGYLFLTVKCNHKPPHIFTGHSASFANGFKCVKGLIPKDRALVEEGGYQIIDDTNSPHNIVVRHIKCGSIYNKSKKELQHNLSFCNSSKCRNDSKIICPSCGESRFLYHFRKNTLKSPSPKCSVCRRKEAYEKYSRAVDFQYKKIKLHKDVIGNTVVRVTIWDNARICNICGKFKSSDKFGRNSKHGVRMCCLECESNVPKGFRICRKCKTLRSIKDFVNGNYPCLVCSPETKEYFRSMMREHVRKLSVSPAPYNNSVYVPLFESCGIMCRESEEGHLQVKCRLSTCNNFITPNRRQIETKRDELLGNLDYQGKPVRQPLYCSDDCKKACREFGKSAEMLIKEDMIAAGLLEPQEGRRVHQKEWAQEVKRRANFECELCGALNVDLIAHHIDPVISNPIESADYNNGVALCYCCDRKVHRLPKCSYSELSKCQK